MGNECKSCKNLAEDNNTVSLQRGPSRHISSKESSQDSFTSENKENKKVEHNPLDNFDAKSVLKIIKIQSTYRGVKERSLFLGKDLGFTAFSPPDQLVKHVHKKIKKVSPLNFNSFVAAASVSTPVMSPLMMPTPKVNRSSYLFFNLSFSFSSSKYNYFT